MGEEAAATIQPLGAGPGLGFSWPPWDPCLCSPVSVNEGAAIHSGVTDSMALGLIY